MTGQPIRRTPGQFAAFRWRALLLVLLVLVGCGKRGNQGAEKPRSPRTASSSGEAASTDSLEGRKTSSASVAADLRLAGHWSGTAAIAGLDTVQVFLDLGQAGSRWVGQYDVPEYHTTDYPLDVEVDSLITLEFGGIEADFRGHLEKDALVGEMLYGGRAYRTRFVRTGAPELSPEFLALESASQVGTRPRPLSADARELRDQFNIDRDRPRLVLLLSPS